MKILLLALIMFVLISIKPFVICSVDSSIRTQQSSDVVKYNSEKVKVYPNPFINSEGHTIITFSPLSSSTEINIFSLSGELVISSGKLNKESTWVWYVKDEKICQGIYIYVIISQKNKITGKITIVK